ncbi:DUF397 domain-containing protein [Dactylosporangium siamense]|uniref:DUF397 domain-containing protein n=1 Tax=Dactylosporangium siamense TaxID=685454 RepID=A0A919PSU3_9ACTN|nr:DUF397 domain-containing protein [Dactylosporangium siamense]GIG47718.1 hypothetical protein Dsi01nite_057590 [Dactylosporangium siamense]
MAALNERWHKPTRSGNNGQCVEARFVDGVVEVRNSNAPDAGSVCFTRAEWETFIAAVDTDGEFRLP